MIKARGRKKRAVGQHTYCLPLEPRLIRAIEELITTIDYRPAEQRLPVSRWCTLAIGQAHGYDGLQLPSDLITTAPTVPALSELRAFASAIDAHLTSGQTQPSWRMVTIRLDQPLADIVNPRAVARGMSYTTYLREVLRYAAGCYQRPLHEPVQLEIAM